MDTKKIDETEPVVKFVRKRKLGKSTIAPRVRSNADGTDNPEDNSYNNNKDSDVDDNADTVIRSTAKKHGGLTVASSSSSAGPAASKLKTSALPSTVQTETPTSDTKFSFKASGTAASLVTDTATRTLDIDGILNLDGTIPNANPNSNTTDNDNDSYRGLAGYKEYVNKKVTKVTQSNAGGLRYCFCFLFFSQKTNHLLRAGPLKGQTSVRITARFDYQQDICKDYKDSGNCGFGDSCIYMHDRGDYKTGWQLDKEWEDQQKQKQKEEDVNRFLIQENSAVGTGEGEDEDEDDVPTECPICVGQFKDPIITKCRHYFCENCALKQFAKTPKCFECGEPTGGNFAVAKELKANLIKKKAKIAEREAAVRKRIQEELGEDHDDTLEDDIND
ncbi:hypothetical protein HK100_000486 [Physocladia obscura]|uniref:Pre-mRNA-splicing factor CWC24 n=1 Tax=Physocladia obscura TaxID=109957 RepID=A0AAD5XKV6_9FUNG|nr:hypothetical protein HK100_000486 [Physocladia obscura]